MFIEQNLINCLKREWLYIIVTEDGSEYSVPWNNKFKTLPVLTSIILELKLPERPNVCLIMVWKFPV